jgi:hypothetical protein
LAQKKSKISPYKDIGIFEAVWFHADSFHMLADFNNFHYRFYNTYLWLALVTETFTSVLCCIAAIFYCHFFA